MIAQAERDIEKIRSGEATLGADGMLLPTAKPREGLEFRVDVQRDAEVAPLSLIMRQRRTLNGINEMQRAVNLQKTVIFAEEAAEELKDDKVSEEPVDDDWFTRWRDFAQDVSDEQMQRAWGRILAGEVKQPNSYSLHALHMMSRMSKSDAELIAKLAYLATGNAILQLEVGYYDKIGLGFVRLLYLSDIGVLNGISGIGGLTRKFGVNSFLEGGVQKRAFLIPIRPYVLVVVYLQPDLKEVTIPAFSISLPAQQLLRLVTPSIHMDYLREVVKALTPGGFESVRLGLGNFDGPHLTVNVATLKVLDL